MAETDLPEISQDPNVPLPEVPPNSALVPYRTGSRPTVGPPNITVGYAPRARQTLQPPSQGAAGIPDSAIRAAFQQLPVDDAIKAVNAAQQFMGQRLFQKAVQSGTPIPQAWATYAPMMFTGRNPTGVIEAMQASAPAKPQVHFGAQGQVLRLDPKTGAVIQLRPPDVKPAAPKTMTEGERMRLALEAQNQMKLGSGELATDPSYQSRTNLAQRVLNSVMPQAKPKSKEKPPTEETETKEATPVQASTPTAPVTTPPTVANPYKVGSQYGTMRYKGGDPNKKSSWETVE